MTSAISLHKVKTLLDREDIENLLAYGAPHDEYEREAEMIYNAVTRLQSDLPQDFTTERVTSAIQEVWEKMFGPFEPDQLRARELGFRKIAAEICTATEEHGIPPGN